MLFGQYVVLIHGLNQSVRHAFAEGAALELHALGANVLGYVGEDPIAGDGNNRIHFGGHSHHVHGNAKFPFGLPGTVGTFDDGALAHLKAAVTKVVQEGNLVQAIAVNDISDGTHQAAVANAKTEHFGVGQVVAVSLLGGVVHVLHIHKDGDALPTQEATRGGVAAIARNIARGRVQVEHAPKAPHFVLEVQVAVFKILSFQIFHNLALVNGGSLLIWRAALIPFGGLIRSFCFGEFLRGFLGGLLSGIFGDLRVNVGFNLGHDAGCLQGKDKTQKNRRISQGMKMMPHSRTASWIRAKILDPRGRKSSA